MPRFLTLLLLALVPFLNSCVASGTRQIEIPLDIDVSSYSSIRVDLDAPSGPALSEFRTLQGMLLSRLDDVGTFEKAVAGGSSMGADCELILRLELINMRRVSLKDRGNFGGLAGQGEVDLRVIILESSGGKILGSCLVEGKSSGGWTGAGDTFQALQMTANQIMDFLLLDSGAGC